jgi:predicted ATPase
MITRLRANNFKSLRSVDLRLGALTVLVGENGAGKSNVLDALRFIKDALDHNLDHAVRDRGGIDEVRRRTSGHPTNFTLHLDLSSDDFAGTYRVRVAAVAGKEYRVAEETCEVTVHGEVSGPVRYRVVDGVVEDAPPTLQAAPDKRDLFLRAISGQPPFDRVFWALRSVSILNPNPGVIREYQKPDASQWLARDARNLASVVKGMAEHDREAMERVVTYLGALVPGVTAMRHHAYGPRETLLFQQVMDNDAAWSFYATSMSDGTLRAAAILVGIFQRGALAIGIEEPEVALHPGAARVLADAIAEASDTTQVVFTTHSPELLDHEGVSPDYLYVVGIHRGVTILEPVPVHLRDVVRDGLFTVGELLRMGQLVPGPAEIAPAARSVPMFDRD